MKIRTGFVSNSSTSSFVMIGIEVTKEIKEVITKELVEKYNLNDDNCDDTTSLYCIFDAIEQLGKSLAFQVFGDGSLLGTPIVRITDECLSDFSISFDAFVKDAKKLKEIIEASDIECPEIKIYGGTESC